MKIFSNKSGRSTNSDAMQASAKTIAIETSHSLAEICLATDIKLLTFNDILQCNPAELDKQFKSSVPHMCLYILALEDLYMKDMRDDSDLLMSHLKSLSTDAIEAIYKKTRCLSLTNSSDDFLNAYQNLASVRMVVNADYLTHHNSAIAKMKTFLWAEQVMKARQSK